MVENFIEILNTSSPWLLIGFFVGGLIHTYLPLSVVRKFLQKDNIRSCVNASLVGLPLPLCSCSVLPVAMSLRNQGASKGATASFLVSTPEIGVDSALLSYGLLGLPFTLFRIISSAITAMVTGVSVTLLSSGKAGKKELESCCSSSCEHQIGTLKYAFVKLPSELATTLTAGFLLAAMFPYFFSEQLDFISESHPLVQVIIALVVSFPTYVCSVGATPIAASLLYEGVYPGAVLVFLLAGPATNIATVLAVRQMLGLQESICYVASVILSTLVLGVGFSFLFEQAFEKIDDMHGASSQLSVASICLIGLLLYGFKTRIKP